MEVGCLCPWREVPLPWLAMPATQPWAHTPSQRTSRLSIAAKCSNQLTLTCCSKRHTNNLCHIEPTLYWACDQLVLHVTQLLCVLLYSVLTPTLKLTLRHIIMTDGVTWSTHYMWADWGQCWPRTLLHHSLLLTWLNNSRASAELSNIRSQ